MGLIKDIYKGGITMHRVIDKELSIKQSNDLLILLKNRFIQNLDIHNDIDWEVILAKLNKNPKKLWSLYQMENTGGEPDFIFYDKDSDKYIFFDTAKESPIGRRNLCYDKAALDSRKQHKPENNVIDVCDQMGVQLLSEDNYRYLQTLKEIDTKTSSWIKTPDKIRSLGGALFCDYRYKTVFVYHNGADSYYASRGFRASLAV